jgi:hypothetical protein
MAVSTSTGKLHALLLSSRATELVHKAEQRQELNIVL